MRNKTNAVLEHLKTKGSITSMEAIELYGATRLSAIIYNLRHHYNMTITNEGKTCIDRFGNKCYYDAYIYEEEQ